MSTSITKPRRLALGAAVLGVALLLAGCSAAAAPAAPSSTQSRQAGGQAGQGGRGAGFGGGGIFGQIAAVTGNTMQVQSSTAQTAVTVAPTTTVLQTAKGSIADVTVGACVVASSFGGGAAGSTPTLSAGGAVSSVAITPVVNGACTGGFGGGFGGGTGTRPSNRPSTSPRPSAPRNRTFTPPVAGKVTAVSGSTITVAADANGTTSSKTVTTGSSTTFTVTAKATSAALTVGKCATVRGAADSAGTVAATSVTVSDPSANGCAAPFGRGGGFGGTPTSPQSGASGPNA